MIVVIGSVVVRPGELERALELSLTHVHRSRVEPGCHSHAVHRDAEHPHRLVFVEEWADRASLATHFSVPGSREFVQEIGALCSEPPRMSIFEATPVDASALRGGAP